jgi:predicted acylesterase/phospholipase RssA
MIERASSDHNKQRALVLQGGGALGAYEVGVIKGLCKKLMEKDMKKGTNNRPLFDIIAGTSIGAMNAAVLLGNVVKKGKAWDEAVKDLEEFWTKGIALKEGDTPNDDIVPIGIFRIFPWWKPWAEDTPRWALCANENSSDVKTINIKDLASEEAARRYYSTKEFVYKGKKVFSIKTIRPDTKFLNQDALAHWVVLDDTPLQSQIELFGDLPIATRFDKGEPRLLITAVDIAEGIAVTFDSYKKADGKRKTVYYPRAKYGRKKDEKNSKPIVIEYEDGITIDQVMASGTLPEFYDPKEIGRRKFWDGGVLVNTPLNELLSAHKDYWLNVEKKEVPDLEIYIVNVHSSRIEDKDIPKHYDEVKNRNIDILYGDRTYHDQSSFSTIMDYIDFITRLQDLASNHIKDDNERNAFQNKFKALKNEIAKSTSDTLGEDVKYEDLIRGRFEIKVMRIERKHDAATSTSLKGADITIQTIKALIKEGEEDTKDLIIF